MTYYTILALLFGGLGLSALGFYFLRNLRHEERMQQIRALPFKEEHRTLLQQTPHYNNLCDRDKAKIERSIIEFAYTKEFIGVGIDVTDEMKVIIGFYACLLLLHVKTKSCYAALQTVIVYPSAVMVENLSSQGGIYTKENFIITGQSADHTVVIVWDEAKHEAYQLRHHNVIVHEFAHEIDFMTGELDGVPPLERSKYHEWTRLLSKEFASLHKRLLHGPHLGKYELLGEYAATNEAEFFAVVSERFFESPHTLHEHFPEIYDALQSFYKIDSLALVSRHKTNSGR